MLLQKKSVCVLTAILLMVVGAALPASATIIQVSDVSNLDLTNVYTAVSYRADAANDTIGGVAFYGVNLAVSNDPMGTTITSGNGVQNQGFLVNSNTQPSSISSPNLRYAYTSVAYDDAGGDVSTDTTVANGTYKVQLMLYSQWETAAGQRQVDITVEGVTTSDYDYFVAQGNTKINGALLVQTVNVTDGHLNVTIGTDIATPMLAGMIINTAVPEPSTVVLLAAGLVSLIAYAWRKRK